MLISIITIVLILSILGIDVLMLMPFLGKNRKVRKVSENFQIFLKKESSPGYLLVMCALLSLVIANTGIGAGYLQIWNRNIAGHSLSHWIDDALMAVFFLLVGLELKHEFLYGALQSKKHSLLPIAAAVGGMLLPAIIYLYSTHGTPEQMGFGIPMATDIAFVLAVLSILGKKVPPSLRTFLVALAVVDDLGAIIVIAIFYTTGFSLGYFIAAILLCLTLLLAGQTIKPASQKGDNLLLAMLLVGGAVMWVLLMRSGVHATISGILLALAIPSRQGSHDALAFKLQHYLHNPVYFIILPLFVLANTAIPFDDIMVDGSFWQSLTATHTFAIAAGLLLGKPLGIMLGAWIAVKTKIALLPQNTTWMHIAGAGFLGGIGFTMSIFVISISFTDPFVIGSSKIAVILTSLVAALIGFAIFALCHYYKDKCVARRNNPELGQGSGN